MLCLESGLVYVCEDMTYALYTGLNLTPFLLAVKQARAQVTNDETDADKVEVRYCMRKWFLFTVGLTALCVG